MLPTRTQLHRIFHRSTVNKAVQSTVLYCLATFLPTLGIIIGPAVASASSTDFAIEPVDRQIRTSNGVPTTIGQYPFLTALLSGREVSLEFEDGPSSARFFIGGVVAEFSGEMVDCGFALSVCLEVEDKVCSIILDFPVADHLPITPAMQLQNCRRGGGIAAIFRPNSRNYVERLDLYDGNPSIPAIRVYDDEGYQHLLLALAEGKLKISAHHTIPDSPFCGGSYLGGRWVLTAAHCVVRELSDGSLRVVNGHELLVNVGAYHLQQEKAFTQSVDKILINGYRQEGSWDENDYALLYLDSEPERGEAIVLATADTLQPLIASAESIQVIGWGETQESEPLAAPTLESLTSAIPLVANLQLQSLQSCRSQWRDFLSPTAVIDPPVPDIRDLHVCASSATQQDSCHGDSGSPLIADVNGEWQLAGITSGGFGCGGSLGLPAIFSSVLSFRQWVLEKTGFTLAQHSALGLSDDAIATPRSGGGSVDHSAVLVLALFLLAGLRRCVCCVLVMEVANPPWTRDKSHSRSVRSMLFIMTRA